MNKYVKNQLPKKSACCVHLRPEVKVAFNSLAELSGVSRDQLLETWIVDNLLVIREGVLGGQ